MAPWDIAFNPIMDHLYASVQMCAWKVEYTGIALRSNARMQPHNGLVTVSTDCVEGQGDVCKLAISCTQTDSNAG